MSNPIKILLDVLSAAGILLWGAAVFVGMHFASASSWGVSVPAAVVTVLLMYFFLYMARRYARPSESNDFSAAGVARKWVYFSIYALISVLSAWYVMHGVASVTTLRDQVRPRAMAELQALRDMTSPASGAGATKGSYQEYAEQEMANYRNYNPNSLTSASMLDAEVRDLGDLLLTKSDYKLTAKQIRDFGERADYAVTNWDWLTVAGYVSELAASKPRWDAKLREASATADVAPYASVHTPYAPLGASDAALAEPLVSPGAGVFTWVGLLLVVVLQTMILLSFFAVSVAKIKAPAGLRGATNVTTWH